MEQKEETIIPSEQIEQNRRKNIKKLNLVFWVSVILCISYIIQDIFTRDDFFDKSNEVTLHVMQNTGSGYEWFNRKISTLSMILDALMIAYVFWITPRQIDGLYLLSITVLSLFQMTFLKSLYQDPRPYFVNLDIKTDECGPEFGNPSGHGVNNLVMVYVSHYIADNDCFKMLIKGENGKYKLHQRRFWVNLIGLVLCILIGWARVCLGMHSLNQVLLGWVLGILWILAYICVFYKRFRYFSARIIEDDGFSNKKKYFLAVLVLAYCFIVGMCILVYELSKSYFEIPQLWIEGIVQTCNKPFDSDMLHVSLYHKTFSDMGVFGLVFGIFIGFIFMRGNYNEKKLLENYKKMSKKIILLRVISDIILLALSFGVPWLVIQFTPKSQVYLRFFIAYNLATFLAGFSLVIFRAQLFKMFKCNVEGDLNYKIPNSNTKLVILVEDFSQEQSSNTNENSYKCNPIDDQQKPTQNEIVQNKSGQQSQQVLQVQNQIQVIPQQQQNLELLNLKDKQ
ncbi:PAP2 superfamily protein (macronuclear) [Tetrahymena thermophila SB210]|uniref:PAP2 superfamily protein n=1 Tax=Tetrahymena thermophila (strain SB210) TaxID=312017 RepID=Q23FV4_TETTS|nr:PAP2 superfamily protein [Tetrahymena thermophila SB210]EAR95506.2 PAP2 superfamily protein [Tetrahymena thermophila SB210]|eukprot:XP_001015751.2 PAP2 superfamily protein [Tetrahymena thermophila SB210]